MIREEEFVSLILSPIFDTGVSILFYMFDHRANPCPMFLKMFIDWCNDEVFFKRLIMHPNFVRTLSRDYEDNEGKQIGNSLLVLLLQR